MKRMMTAPEKARLKRKSREKLKAILEDIKGDDDYGPDPISVTSKRNDGDTPLLVAVIRRKFLHVKALLAADADPNATADMDCAPLHYAVGYRSWGIAKALLRAEARIDMVNDFGFTPLDKCPDENWRSLLTSQGKAVKAKTQRSPVSGEPQIKPLDLVEKAKPAHIKEEV